MTMRDTADLIVSTGRVLALDDAGTIAEAIAIRNGRIQALGRAVDLAELRGPRTRVLDMPGATVTPGFNDAHAHMEREGLKLLRPSLAGCRNLADVLARISQVARERPAGEWIVTMPLGAPPYFFDALQSLEEGRPPNRHELDLAAPDHPVCIPGLFGNWGAPPGYTCLNSRALALNGIDRDMRPQAPGIEIAFDADGEPTGVIIERNSRPMVEFDLLKVVPRFSFEDRLAGLELSMKLYSSVGTTSVYEGHGSAAQTIAIYRELWEQRRMKVRAGLVVSPAWDDLDEAERAMRDWMAYARGSGLGDAWLRISGVHVAYGGDHTCASLSRNDLPNTGWSGFVDQAHDPAEFREICRLCLRYGIRLNTIVGDQLRDVVAILEEVAEQRSLAPLRWVIQHIARTDHASLARLKRLGVLVTVIPVYYLWKGGGAYPVEHGDEVVPLRSMIGMGLDPASATDNIPYQPGFTLWTMTERRRRIDDVVLGERQRLDRLAALRSLTVAGAKLTFDEDIKGSLRSGNLADMAVLSADPLTCSEPELKNLRSLVTLVDGRVVYEDTSA